MAASSSRPPAYRPGEAAAAAAGAAAPPPPPIRVAGPSPWFDYQQRAPESTAQANLRKIIAIISTVLPAQPHPNALQSQLVDPPPPPVPLEWGEEESGILSASSEGAERHRIRVDLRLRLGPSIWEMGRRSSPDEEEDHDVGLPSSACSFVGEGTTKVTGVGGGSSGVAAPETAESGIVSENYDGARDPGTMLDSNSPEDGSSEGEWNAGEGRAKEEEVKEDPRAEERGGGRGGADERQGRTCFEVTNIGGNTGAGSTEVSGATKAGGSVGTGETVAEKKRASNMDADNEGDTGRRCRRRDEGYLGLLLEAVRQVSGGLFGDESPRKEEHAEGVRVEQSKAAELDQYEVAGDEKHKLGPVVRSKRGRSQALPSRYRDSVLEPWKKQSSGCHHRPLQRRQTRTAR